MRPDDITWAGPPIHDEALFAALPADLAVLLRAVNGFILFNGGLHVRGACHGPPWHSLRHAWHGKAAFHRLYSELRPEDVPFAEDCRGDQFLLREGRVIRLAAETGEVEALGVDLAGFLAAAEGDDEDDLLSIRVLRAFQADGGSLEPGHLISAYPPFCTKEAEDGVTLAAVPAEERYAFLADLAAQVRAVGDGGTIDVEVTE